MQTSLGSTTVCRLEEDLKAEQARAEGIQAELQETIASLSAAEAERASLAELVKQLEAKIEEVAVFLVRSNVSLPGLLTFSSISLQSAVAGLPERQTDEPKTEQMRVEVELHQVRALLQAEQTECARLAERFRQLEADKDEVPAADAAPLPRYFVAALSAF